MAGYIYYLKTVNDCALCHPSNIHLTDLVVYPIILKTYIVSSPGQWCYAGTSTQLTSLHPQDLSSHKPLRVRYRHICNQYEFFLSYINEVIQW